MNVWKRYVVFFLGFALLCGGIANAADTAAQGGDQNVRALNHFNASLYKIAHFNNKAVLDEEYDTIVNDLDLSAIGDQKLITIIQSLMDALTGLRISEAERAKMQKAYEQLQQDILLEMMKSGGTRLGKSAAKGALEGIAEGPMVALAGAVANVMADMPSIAASAIRPYEEMQERRLALENFEWELDKEKLRQLNELNKQFLAAYWEFLHDSGTPDSRRISEKQITTLLEALKLKNPEARWRTLVRLEKECGAIPDYWYYRADTAHAILKGQGDAGDAKYAADIRACLDRYQQEEALLRKDKTLANLLMLHLATERVAPEEARAELARVVDAFPMDPSKRLFAALVCLQYGLNDEAAEHLQTNLDMEQYEIVSRKLLAEIYEEKADEGKLNALVEKVLGEEAATNQEILYYLGKLSKAERFLKDFGPQLSEITLRVSPSMVGRDSLELVLPVRWELAKNAEVPAVITVDGQEFKASEMKLKDDRLVLTFPKAIKEKELAPKGQVPVSARLETAFEPLTLEGILSFPAPGQSLADQIKTTAAKTIGDVKDAATQEGQSLTGRISAAATKTIEGVKELPGADQVKSAATNLLPGSQATFILQKIVCGNVSLEQKDGAWVFEKRKEKKTPKTWNEAEGS